MFAFVSAAYRNGRVVRDPDAILQQGKDTCLDVENNNDTACCVWETDDWAAAYASLVGKFCSLPWYLRMGNFTNNVFSSQGSLRCGPSC